MRTIICLTLAALLLGSCAEKDAGESTGSIYGVITDKATGEPVRAAGVQLSPTGTNTVTGDEGQYEFVELSAGEYSLHVTKTGYTDLVNYKISVAAGKTNKGDVQLEKLPPSLRVVNDSKQDISELDFGSAEADVARSFSVFNDGSISLEWEIVKTTEWISAISKTEGTLNAGATQAIVVTIDRAKLTGGENVTTVHITSNNGSKQLTVKVTDTKKLPTLNTLAVKDITATTATFNGTITDTGEPIYTERGFVYATTTMPTLENTIAKRTVEVTGTAEFFTNVLGLELGSTYFVRAYAINSVGTAYSTNEVNFTTVAVLPTLRTDAVSDISIGNARATFNGAILSVGDPVYNERGFVYGTVHNPTVEDNTRKAAAGNGTGAFSVNVTDLQVGSVYYVRAYATNTAGTAYGMETTLDFNAIMPQVSTQAANEISIGNGRAAFNGTVLISGDPTYNERGFVYGTVHNPTVEDNAKKIATGNSTGMFSTNVTDLQAGNIYYIRAYATNTAGTAYGTEITLDFNAVMPQVSTQAVTEITGTTATFNGDMTSVGDPTYTEKGFVYGTLHNPTTEDSYAIVSGTGTGIFNANITGLTAGTLLYVRAYAKTGASIIYGEEVSFTPNSPYVVILPVAGLMVQKTDITGNNTVNWSTGNSLCQNSTLDGYTDWRLPTKDELAVLYNERNTIGGFATTWYWSSTYSSGYYWIQSFSSGAQSGDYDYYTNRCRCVRNY